jgi:hypothetical protein
MNPKKESEKLLNQVLPLAETMLRRFGEFYPYGGYLTAEDQVVEIGIQDADSEFPKARKMLETLQRSLREVAKTPTCKAVAIVLYVAVTPPDGTKRKRNAIQVNLEHRSGYAAEVFLPYELRNKSLIFGKTFAQEGTVVFFGDAGYPT